MGAFFGPLFRGTTDLGAFLAASAAFLAALAALAAFLASCLAFTSLDCFKNSSDVAMTPRLATMLFFSVLLIIVASAVR